MASNSISSDSRELEGALRDLSPAALDPDFISRLEAAADESLTTLAASELRLEAGLREHSPAALSGDFFQRLENLTAGVPFPVDEKIVLFPKTGPVIRKPAARKNRPMWAAAAAVALIGAATALLMPNAPAPGPVVKQSSPGSSRPPVPRPVQNYVPAGFNASANATDEGISWHQSDNPHRVVKVIYRDLVTLKDAEGRTIEVEQPRIEYILVPEKVD